MEKMDGKTMDIVAENVGKLKELFPEAFTEGKVDFEALKEVLGTFVDDRDERYSFTWNGKSKARMIAQTPSTGTLRPCKEESVDWDTTQNVFIEGDNLEVLKLLQKSYHKKVKMIYIDPPYNTGKDFVYKDNFKDNIKNYKEITGQVDGEGRNLSNNPETSGRYHTDWLNMMYPRLKLARNLMQDDGLIAVSIDDSEVFQMGKVLDDIFGEESRLACAPWLSEPSGGKEKTGLRTGHEYLLIYFKNTAENVSQEERSTGELNLKDKFGVYRKGRELMKWGGTSLREDRPNQFYPLPTPHGFDVLPYRNDGKEGHWRWGKNNDFIIKALEDPKMFHWELRSFDEGITVEGKTERWVPYEKIRDTKKSVGWSTWLDKYGANADGTRELKELFGLKPFDTPKPTQLIKWFLSLHSDENLLALDFFAGSSATAHAVIQLNKDDGGNRKFIMIQLPEVCDEKSEGFKAGYKTIAEISKERIRRAAAKIKEENPEYDGDLGFKVFKLDSTNIKPWEVDFDMTERTLEDFISNIKPDRREEDVLYEILLKYGLDLTLPISERTIAGKKVFDIGMGALIICLADAISLEVVEGIAKLKDELNPEIMRVVFKDSGFKDDVVKTNAVQILKQAGIVDVRSL